MQKIGKKKKRTEFSQSSKRTLKKEYCVYRYTTYDNEVVYIGKTDSSLKQRIEAHTKEDKFFPYLDYCKIDYIELANRVETDVVERFLINYYKPVLNDKDKEAGLKLISIDIPDWIPYEEYKAEKKDDLLCVKRKVALQNQALFDSAYTAFLEGNNSFDTKELHPSGMLSTVSGPVRITTPLVENNENGYKQFLSSNAKTYFENPFLHQVLIWEPVSSYFLKTKQIEKLENMYSFARVLKLFKENDFLEDGEMFGFCVIKLPEKYANEDIYEYFSVFFYDKPRLGQSSYIEINIEGYNELNNIIEKISKEILKEYRQNDIIPY